MKYIKNILNKLHLFSFVGCKFKNRRQYNRQFKEKVELYKELVCSNNKGFEPMSLQFFNKQFTDNILGVTDDELINDLEEFRKLKRNM